MLPSQENHKDSHEYQAIPPDVVLGYLERLRRLVSDDDSYHAILNDLNTIIYCHSNQR